MATDSSAPESGKPGSTEPGVTEPESTEPALCSARGCAQPATVALLWNNPKIHPPERRKTWVACPQHERSLSDFLGARGFLRETEPVG